VLNIFRTLIHPSSGACDYSVELPHWSYCSWFDVCWIFCVVGLEWYPCCMLQPATRIPLQPNHTENPTHNRTKNNTTNVVIQQNSRKLLMILMSETCWTHKKWNKIASDIKLVFSTSTITMMHGPTNIRQQFRISLFLSTTNQPIWTKHVKVFLHHMPQFYIQFHKSNKQYSNKQYSTQPVMIIRRMNENKPRKWTEKYYLYALELPSIPPPPFYVEQFLDTRHRL